MPITTLIRTVQAAGPLPVDTIIPILFEFPTNGDIQVIESDTDGSNPVTRVLDTDYSLTGAGLDAGGTAKVLIALVSSAKKWTLSRVTKIDQNTDYVENDAFPANSHEAALDKLTLIAQEFTEELGRTLQIPLEGDPTIDTDIPPLVADKVLVVNATASGFALGDFDAGAAAAAAVSAAAALVSEGNAATSATNAATSETNAATSAANSLTSENNAATSAAALVVNLTNKSGGALVLGDVVVDDPTNDNAFTTTTSQGNPDVMGVVLDTSIADDAAGDLKVVGEGKVNCKGLVTRGDFIRSSTTVKQGESAGTSIVDGVFAKALETGTDVLINCVIFNPHDVTASAPTFPADSLTTAEVDGIQAAPTSITASNPAMSEDDVKINSSAEDNLRIIRGTITSGGGITSGSGFTAGAPSGNTYTITFSTNFGSVPSGGCAVVENDGTTSNAKFKTLGTNSLTVFTYTSGVGGADHAFSFVGVGPK